MDLGGAEPERNVPRRQRETEVLQRKGWGARDIIFRAVAWFAPREAGRRSLSGFWKLLEELCAASRSSESLCAGVAVLDEMGGGKGRRCGQIRRWMSTQCVEFDLFRSRLPVAVDHKCAVGAMDTDTDHGSDLAHQRHRNCVG